MEFVIHNLNTLQNQDDCNVLLLENIQYKVIKYINVLDNDNLNKILRFLILNFKKDKYNIINNTIKIILSSKNLTNIDDYTLIYFPDNFRNSYNELVELGKIKPSVNKLDTSFIHSFFPKYLDDIDLDEEHLHELFRHKATIDNVKLFLEKHNLKCDDTCLLNAIRIPNNEEVIMFLINEQHVKLTCECFKLLIELYIDKIDIDKINIVFKS